MLHLRHKACLLYNCTIGAYKKDCTHLFFLSLPLRGHRSERFFMQLLPSSFQRYHSHQITGEILHWPAFPSNRLGYPRDVLIWLPPGYYQDTLRRYPVLYMHDGQNKFDPATSFAGDDWNVDGVATQLIQTGQMEPCIMVAIYNSPDRLYEYSPLRRRGREYSNFIVQELMPLINLHFRTEGGRRNAVMGSSMGGLISLAMLWWHSEHFFGAAALSPSLWILWRQGGPMSWLQRQPAPQQPARLYIDHGTEGYEGRGQELVEQTLRHARAAGFPDHALRYNVMQGGEHNEASWRARVDQPLRFLFGT